FKPAIAAAPPGRPARVRVRRNLLANTFDVLVRPVPPASISHPAVGRLIDTIGGRYCARWGKRLIDGRLDRPIVGSSLLDLTAGAMRTEARAEVALLDRRVLDPAWSPAEDGALTESDVYVALRYDEPLVVASVKGAWVKQVIELDPAWLLTLGATLEDGELRINNRTIEPEAEYRVVSLRLITEGGALPEGPEWQPLRNATLRSALLDHLETPRDEDPRDDLYEPGDRPEWTFRTNVDASYAGSVVNNPDEDRDGAGDYDDTQLQRADTMTFGMASKLRADALAPEWGWDNVGEARYRRTQTDRVGVQEGDDILSLRSTARWRGLRARWERYYVPQPFVEGYLESEFTVPEERAFRHMLLRPQAGVQFTLTDHLSLKVSGGFETELLSPEREVLPGVGGQLVLKSWTMMEGETRRLQVQGDADYFVSDVAGTPKQTLRGRVQASIDLFGPLALGWALDLFVAKGRGQEPGVNSSTEVFLRVGWVGRAVGP
ncbi:MAG: 5'-nucleotidase C-terminal domain-containing protein, partial [Polyangiales bacterium]